MSTHANMVKMTVSSVGADPYTITLNAASSGFQSFADAYGANATVDILITQGTVWEVARNCTYTHSGTTVTRGTFEDSSTGSRITTFDNTAVVSVVATATFGNNLELQLDRAMTSVTTDGSTQQTVTDGQNNKITNINTVVSNPKSWWDNTNKKFTPLRAGTYMFFAASQLVQNAQHTVAVYKNGSPALVGANFASTSYIVSTVSGTISANGTTDYFEVYAYSGLGGTTVYHSNGLFQTYYLGG